MRDLGTLGGPHSEALAINDHGMIVGTCDNSRVPKPDHEGSWMARACLWRSGKVTNLDPAPLAGTGMDAPIDRTSSAWALNERGQIVVNVEDGDGDARAYVWQAGKQKDVSGAVQAFAITERGQVVGDGDNGDAIPVPFVWQGGRTTFLSIWGGSGSAHAINEQRQIVGWVATKKGGQHAVLWQGGTITDLGTLGGSDSEAEAISDSGSVVGSSYARDDNQHAVLWTLKP